MMSISNRPLNQSNIDFAVSNIKVLSEKGSAFSSSLPQPNNPLTKLIARFSGANTISMSLPNTSNIVKSEKSNKSLTKSIIP